MDEIKYKGYTLNLETFGSEFDYMIKQIIYDKLCAKALTFSDEINNTYLPPSERDHFMHENIFAMRCANTYIPGSSKYRIYDSNQFTRFRERIKFTKDLLACENILEFIFVNIQIQK